MILTALVDTGSHDFINVSRIIFTNEDSLLYTQRNNVTFEDNFNHAATRWVNHEKKIKG